MNPFRKLFGGRKSETPSTPSPEPIKAFDEFGREVTVGRKDWLKSVLLPKLDEVSSRPGELADTLVSAFQDGFFGEVEKYAKRLHGIDEDPARGASLLGIVYLQTDRPKQAEKVFNDFLKSHPADGTVLTNLAKAQHAQGRTEEAEKTLWQGLEIDPNQDNALLWFASEAREQGGAEAGVAALRRVAQLPGSWRAQMWLAREALEGKDLAAAMACYEDALAHAGEPTPIDLLMQLSGDLGNHGHLMELVEITAPRFHLETHGLTVGNNLLKAYLDTGQIDAARKLLQGLQSQQRPDWKENLAFWEGELSKADLDTSPAIAEDKLQLTMLEFRGSVGMKEDHATASLFPKKNPDAPNVVFVGSTVEAARVPDPAGAIKPQQTDAPGRFSRAIPLYLGERLFLESNAETKVLIPWIVNAGGGFMVSGRPFEAEQISHLARSFNAGSDRPPADFAIVTHLKTSGENWTLEGLIVRTIDAKPLGQFSHPFAEGNIHTIADRVLQEIVSTLSAEGGVSVQDSALARGIQGPEIDHYLFRSEQVLASRASNLAKENRQFLTNPTEILDGLVFLCLQNPADVPARLLLWRALDSLKEREAGLVASLKDKVASLQSQHPLPDRAQSVLQEAFAEIFS